MNDEDAYLYVDVETTGLDFKKDSFRIGCFTNSQWDDVEFTYTARDTLDKIVDALEGDFVVSGHNIWQFDIPFMLHQLAWWERREYIERLMRYSNRILDTLLLVRLTTGRTFGNSLDELAKTLGLTEKVEVNDWKEASDELIKERVSSDCRIQEELTKILVKECDDYFLSNVFPSLCPFFCSVLSVGTLGIPVDTKAIEEKRMAYEIKSTIEYNRITSRLGKTVKSGKAGRRVKSNLNSNPQVNALMRNKGFPGLPLGEPTEKTGVRNPTMNKDNRHEVETLHPLYSKIYSYRERMQTLQMLGTGTKKSILDYTEHGKCYPDFKIMNQVGLRSSFVSPPINQFPTSMRDIVKARDGHKIVGLDLASLEFACLSYILSVRYGETNLKEELEEKVCPKQKTLDIFGHWFDVFPEHERKSKAKTLNYAIMFGQGISSTLQFFKRVKESRHPELENLLSFRFPGLQKFNRDLYKEYEERGFVRNLYGVPIRPMKDFALLNGFIQSTGCCYAYLYLGYLSKFMVTEHRADVIATMHDEIQWQVKEDFDLSILKKKVQELDASTEQEIYSPFITSAGDILQGLTWGDTH